MQIQAIFDKRLKVSNKDTFEMVHGKYFSQNRDFFFSWMINEYNEQKKPVASSRTFRL